MENTGIDDLLGAFSGTTSASVDAEIKKTEDRLAKLRVLRKAVTEPPTALTRRRTKKATRKSPAAKDAQTPAEEVLA